MPTRPVVLFVGGTDPSCGAGLAADIRAASLLGVHPALAVTAVTVQTTGRVESWKALEPSLVSEQVRSVARDGPVSAVKTGMLATPETVEVLCGTLDECFPGVPLVCDPVLSAGSGDRLGYRGLADAVRSQLVPRSALLTPNIPEASLLTGVPVTDGKGMEEAARVLLDMGASAVLVKGGHSGGPPADLLATRDRLLWFGGKRVAVGNVHGTGCVLSAGIASLLATGFNLEGAVAGARDLLVRGLERSFAKGEGLQLGLYPSIGYPPAHRDEESWYLKPSFCGSCGGELVTEPGDESHMCCSECGAVHYRNPLPAVTLLVHDGNRILLVRRARPPAEGSLCLPGGFMELGETAVECGRRELREETGLVMEDCTLMGIETDSTAYGGIVLAALEVTSWSGEPSPGDDASETVWSDLDSVPELAFRAHDRLVSALRAGTASGREG